jgi:precorrin-3B C17-methyltransferase
MNESKGKIFSVGIGPGSPDEMTVRAQKVLAECEVVIGYKSYIDLVTPFLDGKEVISSGMGNEKERCELAVKEALSGKRVAIISSGDAGIFGMAGLVLEIVRLKGAEEKIPVEIVPGVPAFVAAASLVGAPLMNDFAVISLSDLLIPWNIIEKKLEAAAACDLVTCLYNPRSSKRVHQVERARDIFLKHRDRKTPCAIIRNVSRSEQSLIRTTLDDLLNHKIDMLCVVIIGNSETYLNGQWMITPRGYKLSNE